jgi:hypothetical protein
MANKKIDISNAQKLGIGVGLTTAAVAAVGAYFLYGTKDAKKNRKQVKSWALKAKGEVLGALEKADKMTQGEFNELVNKVVGAYAKVEKVSKKDLEEFKKEMGENWQGLVKSGVAKVFDTQALVKQVMAKMPPQKAVKKAVAKKVTPVAKKAMKKVAVAKKK